MLAGCHRGPILLEDANDLAEMAEALRRTVPAGKWVEEALAEAEYADVFGG